MVTPVLFFVFTVYILQFTVSPSTMYAYHIYIIIIIHNKNNNTKHLTITFNYK